MKEKPLEFIKTAFTRAIQVIEEKITLNEFGLIDESLVTPVVREIIQRFFPVNLLSPFCVNIDRLVTLEKEIHLGRSTIFSKSSLNTLKRMIAIKYSIEARSLNAPDQLVLFKKMLIEGRFTEEIPFLYNEAVDLLNKVLKVNIEDIHEVLWLGSSSIMNLFLPYGLFAV